MVKNRIYANRGLKKPFSERSGSSAEINLLLTLMLQNAGIKADPVMFSTRENGSPLSVFPTISKFNSVLTKVDIQGKIYLLDATSDYCALAFSLPAMSMDKAALLITLQVAG
jgi:hypothetical protein